MPVPTNEAYPVERLDSDTFTWMLGEDFYVIRRSAMPIAPPPDTDLTPFAMGIFPGAGGLLAARKWYQHLRLAEERFLAS